MIRVSAEFARSMQYAKFCAAMAFGLDERRIEIHARPERGLIQVTIKFGPFRPRMTELAASFDELAQEMPCGTILEMIYVMPEDFADLVT